MTHKKEWDAFTRQLKTGSQIPGAVSEYAVSQSGKKELFGMWLDAKQDWDECSLILKRKLENSSTAERGWCAIQGRELKLRYTEAKWNSLRDSRKAAGLWYEDEDFPGDDDDTRFHSGLFVSMFRWFPSQVLKWLQYQNHDLYNK